MSTVVDVVSSDEDDSAERRDPFAEGAIEIDDETIRRVSPAAWAGRVTDRIDDLGHRLIHGR